MEKTNHLVTGALLAGMLIFAGAYAFLPNTQVKEVQVPVQVGAVASPYIQSRDFSYGGAMFRGAHVDLTTTYASSPAQTVCAMDGPSATSTIQSASVQITNPLAVSIPIEMAWGAASGATTTVIARGVIPASKTLTLVATSTIESGASLALTDNIMQRDSFINVRISSSSVSANFIPGAGSACNATWAHTN
jgi:hypothetical protein